MKISLLSFLFVTQGVAVQAQTPSDTLRQLDSAWARSYATNDTALAAKLFDDSLIVTSGNGRLKGKKGEMTDVGPAAPNSQIHYFRTGDVVARAYGQAGVVIGLAEWRYTFNGNTATYRRRYTAVYARRGAAEVEDGGAAHRAGAGVMASASGRSRRLRARWTGDQPDEV